MTISSKFKSNTSSPEPVVEKFPLIETVSAYSPSKSRAILPPDHVRESIIRTSPPEPFSIEDIVPPERATSPAEPAISKRPLCMFTPARLNSKFTNFWTPLEADVTIMPPPSVTEETPLNS